MYESEADENYQNSLNSNLNDGEDDLNDFDASNVPSLYGLRLNPKYYGTLHNLMSKRLKGSEFLGMSYKSRLEANKR